MPHPVSLFRRFAPRGVGSEECAPICPVLILNVAVDAAGEWCAASVAAAADDTRGYQKLTCCFLFPCQDEKTVRFKNIYLEMEKTFVQFEVRAVMVHAAFEPVRIDSPLVALLRTTAGVSSVHLLRLLHCHLLQRGADATGHQGWV